MMSPDSANIYRIVKTDGAPNWDKIDTLSVDIPYLNSPADYRTWAQFAYDDDKLYVHFSCEEPATRADERGLIGVPCEDCCMEFFFAPMQEDIRYFNIEFNYNACMYLGIGSSLDTLVRLLPDCEDNVLYPHVYSTDTGWEIFYTIPFEFVRRFFPNFTVYRGKVMRANCYKCADKTVPPHYFSWNPIVYEGEFTFHAPKSFGTMIFD